MKRSAFSAPVLMSDGEAQTLERIQLQSDPKFEYNEKWLQDFLFSHPSSIPTEEIDTSYSTLIPVCCELSTNAGYLDILYVTESGKLAIVEVKLWRNPEARRKVVAQVLDYAKELNRWDYEDLQREVSKLTGIKGNALYQIASKEIEDLDETSFVDGVSRSMKSGDFLLLIIGDGIQEGTENIADFMNNVGRLQFTLGLVDVSLYRVNEQQFLVQPKVLAKTVIIERRTFDLLSPQIVEAGEEEEPSQEISQIKLFYTEFWKDYLDQMQLDDVSIPHSSPTAENFYLYPAYNKESWISAFMAKSQQRVGVYFRAPKGEYGQFIYQTLLDNKKEIVEQIGEDVVWEDMGEGREKYVTISKTFTDVHSSECRPGIFEFYNQHINDFVNALRPLLKDLKP